MAWSAVTVTKAPSVWFSCPILARKCSATSVAESSPAAKAWRNPAAPSSWMSAKEAGLQALFHGNAIGRIAGSRGDAIGSLAPDLGNHVHKFRAPVNQPDAVVGAVRFAQHALRHQLVDQGAAARLGVIMDAVGVGEEV